MEKPLWPLQRSDVSCSWPHISGGILSHSSLQILSESLRFRGWQLATRTFHSLDRLSMGLRSGDWLDHSRTLMCFFLSHSFVALAVCLGSLSCWNTHPRPILNALALTVHGPAHRPFDVVQLSCPFSRKAPPKQNVSTSMFNGGDGVLGVIDSIPPPPNTASWVDAKELNFWSQLLANFRRPVHVFSWAGGPCGSCKISVLHGVVCYQLFSCWLWSQLPWDHWPGPPV